MQLLFLTTNRPEEDKNNKGMFKKFNLRWLSLSKPPYLVQWSFRQVVPEPVEGLNDRYSHYLLDSPFFMTCYLFLFVFSSIFARPISASLLNEAGYVPRAALAYILLISSKIGLARLYFFCFM